jgi:hypothetical protein
LRDLAIEPSLLDFLPGRRLTDRLNRRDFGVPDAVDRRDAGTDGRALDMDRARAAERHAAAELRAGHAKHIAQYPQQRSIAVDVYRTIGPIYLDQEGHPTLRLGTWEHRLQVQPGATVAPAWHRGIAWLWGRLAYFGTSLEVRVIKAVIPPRSTRKVNRACDFALYAERNLVERFFNAIKHYRGIATRYEKTARNFLAGLHLVCALAWLK